MMMLPRRNDFALLDDIFKDPFFSSHENKVMKTDIKESEEGYLIVVDLPGYNKDDIKIDVEDGYLTINAKICEENNEEQNGKFVRRERYFGECSRSFYVGDAIKTEDVKASYKNGTLKLEITKKEVRKEISEKKYVQIDD